MNCRLIFLTFFFVGSVLHGRFSSKKISVEEPTARLEFVSLENGTDSLEFQLFPSQGSAIGLVLPGKTLELKNGFELSDRDPAVIKCSKGSYLPVFIKDGLSAGGIAPEGYVGPYYISMWMSYPNISEASKLNIPYVLKEGEKGKVGIKIGSRGDYRFVAGDGISFLE